MPSWDTLPLEHSPAGAVPRWFVGQHGEWSAADEPTEAAESDVRDLHDPCRWGLSAEATATVGARLSAFWLRFRDCCTTRTRDTSANAANDLRGPWTMDNERHFANRARHMTGDDGQALQHCMANSPWSGPAVFGQMQAEIKATPAWAQGSTLMLDERADETAGTPNAGASRPYHGRMGQVDVGRVDPCLTYANGGLWAMVDGALFVPEEWVGAACAQTRHALGIPQERTFETHIALGLQMLKRVKANGVPFDLLACDALYGRERQVRAEGDAAGGLYAAQVPADTNVYVSEPQVGVPVQRSTRGRPRTRLQVLSRQRPGAVRVLARPPQTVGQQVMVRDTERGRLAADGAVQRVWTVAAGKKPRVAWLVRRREAQGDCSYTLRNALEDAPPERLIAWSGRRDFLERTFEDAKTAIGWDECQAQKYRAGEHHLALTAASLWCVAQTKLAWAQDYPRDPDLARELAVEGLPGLSTANVRELLKAVLPVPQLTLAQATDLVITHLVNRTRSTSSRLKSQMKPHDSS